MNDETLPLNTLYAICRKLDGMLQDKRECAHLVHYLFSRMDEDHPLYQEIHRIVYLLADVRSLMQEARDIAGSLKDAEERQAREEDD